MTDAIVQWLLSAGEGKFLATVLISMLPVIELRGGLPAGVAMGLPLREAFFAALLYGHTHIRPIDYHEGLWIVNPGSIGDHRRPSYGVLTVEGDKLSPANFTLE